jgi:hypothetical protein
MWMGGFSRSYQKCNNMLQHGSLFLCLTFQHSCGNFKQLLLLLNFTSQQADVLQYGVLAQCILLSTMQLQDSPMQLLPCAYTLQQSGGSWLFDSHGLVHVVSVFKAK